MLAKPLFLKASSLSKTPLALALSLAMGTISTALWPAAVNAEPNISVLKTLEMTNSSPATVCLTMSGRQVVDDSFSNLSKNVKVTLRNQPVDVPVAVTQDNLCIDKLESGKTYNVLLKKGLKFKSGSTLEESTTRLLSLIALLRLSFHTTSFCQRMVLTTLLL